MGDSELFFRLDQRDRIVEVGGSWDRLAIENDGPGLLAKRIEGQSLFAHVAGQPTRDFVWTVLNAVRILKRPHSMTYRCDSPGVKRHMEMTIEPGAGGSLCLHHRLISTEAIKAQVLFKAAAPGTGGSQLTMRCSSCNRLKVDGAWLEPESAVATAKDKLPFQGSILRVAYSVCSNCRNMANRPTKVAAIGAQPRNARDATPLVVRADGARGNDGR